MLSMTAMVVLGYILMNMQLVQPLGEEHPRISMGGRRGHSGGLQGSRVMLQTTGATPLFIASQKGNVECVRALLDVGYGAAIDQASVGCAHSMTLHCWGCAVSDRT
jgi:hypothetical protein